MSRLLYSMLASLPLLITSTYVVLACEEGEERCFSGTLKICHCEDYGLGSSTRRRCGWQSMYVRCSAFESSRPERDGESVKELIERINDRPVTHTQAFE